jgi:hypothetical protein
VHVTPGLELRLRPELQLGVGLDWSRNTDDVQWLGNFTDTAGVTHYSFARLEQTTRTLTVRGSYTITPTLGLQVFAAPFVSRGRYGSVRELSTTPRADRYQDRYQAYTPPPARTSASTCSSCAPTACCAGVPAGSTLFAVWQHGTRRVSTRATAPRGWRSEYGDLFGLHPANTFLIKMAYWLN